MGCEGPPFYAVCCELFEAALPCVVGQLLWNIHVLSLQSLGYGAEQRKLRAVIVTKREPANVIVEGDVDAFVNEFGSSFRSHRHRGNTREVFSESFPVRPEPVILLVHPRW